MGETDARAKEPTGKMYYVLKEDRDETHVYVGNIPKEIKKQYQLKKGVSRLNDWPESVVFEYSKKRPDGMVLTDYVENPSCWLLISNGFKEILEEFNVDNLEFLPVQFKNHKGRMASDEYWIGNFTTLTDAVDREASEFRKSPVDEDQITTFDKLALREDVLKSGPAIFRLKEQPMLVIAREDVVERAREEDLTGLIFVETEKFKSLDPDH